MQNLRGNLCSALRATGQISCRFECDRAAPRAMSCARPDLGQHVPEEGCTLLSAASRSISAFSSAWRLCASCASMVRKSTSHSR